MSPTVPSLCPLTVSEALSQGGPISPGNLPQACMEVWEV